MQRGSRRRNSRRSSSGSSTDVASFDRHERSAVERIQHILHSNPALVPLIVLIASLAVFGALLGSKFFSAFTLTLILQQVSIVGIVGAAQTLVILTAGIDLSVGAIMVICSVVMGQFTFRYGIPAPISILCGFGVGAAIGFINGFLVARIKLAALHRHAGHVADRAGGELPLFAQRNHPEPGHRRDRPDTQVVRRRHPVRRRRSDLWRDRHGDSGAGAGLRAQQHRLGTARLCHRRRSGRGGTVRRSGREDADLGLCALGADLRAGRMGC